SALGSAVDAGNTGRAMALERRSECTRVCRPLVHHHGLNPLGSTGVVSSLAAAGSPRLAYRASISLPRPAPGREEKRTQEAAMTLPARCAARDRRRRVGHRARRRSRGGARLASACRGINGWQSPTPALTNGISKYSTLRLQSLACPSHERAPRVWAG